MINNKTRNQLKCKQKLCLRSICSFMTDYSLSTLFWNTEQFLEFSICFNIKPCYFTSLFYDIFETSRVWASKVGNLPYISPLPPLIKILPSFLSLFPCSLLI